MLRLGGQDDENVVDEEGEGSLKEFGQRWLV
jgi:hypothetical protein